MKHLLLSTDPGLDDLLALTLAIRSPEAHVAGIVATAGNESVAVSARRVMQLLDFLGACEIPVARGSNRRDRFVRQAWKARLVQKSELCQQLESSAPPPSRMVKTPAGDLVLEAIHRHPGELTVVALAPLTDIAEVLRRHPAEFRRIRELVVLGGAFNTTNWTEPPGRELNMYVNPRAAAVVLGSGFPNITLIPLDVANHVCLTAEKATVLRGAYTAEARFLHQAYAAWCLATRRDVFPLWDPLAVAVAIDPGLARTEQRSIKVHTAGRLFGRTTLVKVGPVVNVVTRVDEAEFWRRFMMAMGVEPARASVDCARGTVGAAV